MSNLDRYLTGEMVEIAARAMWDHDWPDKPWESLPDDLADYYRSSTRTTLESVAPLIAAKAWEEGYAEGSRGRMWESANPYQTHAEAIEDEVPNQIAGDDS